MVHWRGIELPGFDRGTTPLAASRRVALIAHLKKGLVSLRAPVAPSREPANPSTPDVGAACRACRGHCCRNGGNTAYLDREAIALAWSELPHLSKDGLLTAYADAIPAVSFADSCIFHAENGCNLPPKMRSPVCRDYLCDALLQHRINLSLK